MAWSPHLHVKQSRNSHVVRRFLEKESGVVISWQLRGLSGNHGMYIRVIIAGVRGNLPGMPGSATLLTQIP